jgi:hypothetical protein
MVWQPYSDEILFSLPNYCIENRIVWLARVPLICFCIVEWHLPDRVKRQFGFRQSVPDAIDTSRELHKVDFRRNNDWTTKHHNWIIIWEQRYDNIIQGVPDAHPMEDDDEYMHWYRRISRRFMCRKLWISDYMVSLNFYDHKNVVLYCVYICLMIMFVIGANNWGDT